MHPLGDLRRTHTCGALRPSDVGQQVVLLGWVQTVRDLGSLLFLDVRDRYGVTQVVARDDEALVAAAKKLRTEMVVGGARRGRAAQRGHHQPEARRPARSRSSGARCCC